MTDSEERRITVVLVDDHEMVALGIKALVEHEPGIEVVGWAGSVEKSIQMVEQHRPDVVLMDYRLPDGNGAEASRRISRLENAPGIIMATSVVDRRVLGQALDAGCCGFISKHADRSDLVDAIRAAAQRDSYFTRDVLSHLVQLRRFDAVDDAELSEREIAVLQATADGFSPDEIAAQMFLSAHTVKNHIRHAMGKLDAHTKLEAVVKAIRSRIISIDE